MKQRQQKELAESIIAKIQKELENPKTMQQILNQSISDIESKLIDLLRSKLRLTYVQELSHRNHNKGAALMMLLVYIVP